MNFFIRHTTTSFIIGVCLFLGLYFFLLPKILSAHYVAQQMIAPVTHRSVQSSAESKKEIEVTVSTVTHVVPPTAIHN